MRAGGSHPEIDSQQAARILAAPASQTQEKDHQVGVMMAGGAGYSRALILGASVFSIAALASRCRLCADGGCASRAPVAGTSRNRPSASRRNRGAEQQASSPVHECARAGRRRAGAVARHHHRCGVEDRRARDRRAGAGQRGDARTDPGPAAEPAVRHLLQRARRVVPGARRRSRDRRSIFAACRISAASRSSSTARGRTISAPATTPTARSSSIPN